MSNPINNGGPAFPCKGIPLDPETYLNHPGMTLRDWFAGMTLQEMIGVCGSRNLEELASWSYEIADAMLAARNGGDA